MYTTYVRPHLEFAIQAWSPYLSKDKAVIEKVQHRATKIPHVLKSLSYEKRCEAWNITSLDIRRTRGDLIQKFKLEKQIDDAHWHIKPTSIPPRAGHRKRFHRKIVRSCLPRHNFFKNRVVNQWNELADYAVEATTMNEFKSRLL